MPTALTIPTNLVGEQGGVVTASINVDNLNDGGSHTGLSGGDFVLFYNSALFTVSNSDIGLGTVPNSSSGWTVTPTTSTPGYINIVLADNGTPIASSAGGSLVTVNFHVNSSAPFGATKIDLAADNALLGSVTQTTFINDASGNPYNTLSPAPADNATSISPSYVYSGTDSSDGTITVTGATHFTVSAPSSVAAGSNLSFTVTAKDQFGNTDPFYAGTVVFSSTDGSATLPASSTLNNGSGIFSATLVTGGTQSLTTTDSGNVFITGQSNNITVSTAATHFTVSAASSTTAGAGVAFVVTAQDALNNTAISYTGMVVFSSSDGQATVPSNATLNNGTGVFAAVLRTSGNQTLTATDSVTGSITGHSGTISVSAAAATHFVVNAPGTASTGQVPFTVTAEDQFNNIAPTYAGTVAFSSSDGAAVLPANSPLTNGAGTFTVTLKTPGNQTLTATDNQTSSITGHSGTIVVSPGVATHFAVTASPSSITAGNTVTLTVTAQDQFNNTSTGYIGTVTFSSTDHGASTLLPANSTLVSGVGTFSATLTTAGSQTLTVADSGTSSIAGASNSVTVSPAALAHFGVTSPGSATAGAGMTFTVTAQDTFNNTVTSYSGTVALASSDTTATFAPAASGTLSNGAGASPSH